MSNFFNSASVLASTEVNTLSAPDTKLFHLFYATEQSFITGCAVTCNGIETPFTGTADINLVAIDATGQQTDLLAAAGLPVGGGGGGGGFFAFAPAMAQFTIDATSVPVVGAVAPAGVVFKTDFREQIVIPAGSTVAVRIAASTDTLTTPAIVSVSYTVNN